MFLQHAIVTARKSPNLKQTNGVYQSRSSGGVSYLETPHFNHHIAENREILGRLRHSASERVTKDVDGRPNRFVERIVGP